jgi:hypothetical protein
MAATRPLLAAATATRNDALEFAARTLKNMDFLERAYAKGADVHVVTQLVNSQRRITTPLPAIIPASIQSNGERPPGAAMIRSATGDAVPHGAREPGHDAAQPRATEGLMVTTDVLGNPVTPTSNILYARAVARAAQTATPAAGALVAMAADDRACDALRRYVVRLSERTGASWAIGPVVSQTLGYFRVRLYALNVNAEATVRWRSERNRWEFNANRNATVGCLIAANRARQQKCALFGRR